jgi:hypothetical protein
MRRGMEINRDREHLPVQSRVNSYFLSECKSAKNTDAMELLIEDGCDIHYVDEVFVLS